MAGDKKTKSFAGLVKTAPTLSDFDKEMVGMHDIPDIKVVHEINENHANNEFHTHNELEEINALVPFSTRISRGTYKKVRQFEYWERATITEIVEMALTQFLENKEAAEKELPSKEIKRLEELSKKKKKGIRK